MMPVAKVLDFRWANEHWAF